MLHANAEKSIGCVSVPREASGKEMSPQTQSMNWTSYKPVFWITSVWPIRPEPVIDERLSLDSTDCYYCCFGREGLDAAWPLLCRC
jgi:hypothetical protein